MTHKTTTFGGFDRRAFLRSGAALGALSVTGLPAFAQAGHEITIADIGVGDPGGDWSRFSDATGHSVNMVSIGNAPAAIINQLLAGGLRHHQHRGRHAKALGGSGPDPEDRPLKAA